jgi:hypothetical protein
LSNHECLTRPDRRRRIPARLEPEPLVLRNSRRPPAAALRWRPAPAQHACAAGWKPKSFGFEVLGCRHRLEFPVVKLIEFAGRLDRLEKDPNPFALVTAAHLRTRQTKNDPEARYRAKRELMRLLYRHGWSRKRIVDLFAVLDWMMSLPDVLEQKLWQDVKRMEGETRMRYVTSVERLAIEKGMQRGIQRGGASVLERQLVKRFGPLSEETRARLRNATAEQLELWAERILDAPTLAAVFEEH